MDFAMSDVVLFGALIYVAVMSLVRLMDARKRQVLAELNEEVRQAKIEQLQSNLRQIKADKAEQSASPPQKKSA
jgi:type II secretory pathway pseudopilin PulG